jgi:Clr5 domain
VQNYIHAFVSRNDIEHSTLSTFTASNILHFNTYRAAARVLLGPKGFPNMASPKIVLYQPNPPPRSGRIDAKEWDKLRPRIEELYIKDERKLGEAMEIMALQYSFYAR